MKELEIRLNENNTISFHDYIETRIVYEKLCKEKDKEIERLNNIIKEVREYIESYMPNYDFDKTNLIKLLEILNKGSGKE